MRFGEKVVVFILRPIYRTFFERLIWWYLTKIKAFFMAETSAQAAQMRAQIAECLRRLESIEERLRDAEANNAAQWDGIEQLLLALFRQPETQHSGDDWGIVKQQEVPVSSTSDLNRVHAAGSIR